MAGTANSGGRNKLGAQAHVLKGTFRSDRHGDGDAPEAPKGKPGSPRQLEGLAAEEWDAVCADLELQGTLAKTDRMAIFQYCCLYAETEAHVETRSEVTHAVRILEENIGDLKGPELVAAFQEISKMRKLEAGYASQIRSGRMGIRQWLVEFGLTPVARSRVKLPPQKPKSKVDSFRDAKAGA